MATTPLHPNDDLTLYSVLGILQCGMVLPADLERCPAHFALSRGRFPLVLWVIEAEGSCRIGSDIAAILGVSKATVATMVERLVEEGCLADRAVPGDRRRRHHALTPRGKKLFDRIIPGCMARLRIMSAGVTPFEKQHLISILSKIDFLGTRKSIIPEHHRTLSERGGTSGNTVRGDRPPTSPR